MLNFLSVESHNDLDGSVYNFTWTFSIWHVYLIPISGLGCIQRIKLDSVIGLDSLAYMFRKVWFIVFVQIWWISLKMSQLWVIFTFCMISNYSTCLYISFFFVVVVVIAVFKFDIVLYLYSLSITFLFHLEI